ncbi:MAG: hypothetical protein HQK75_08465 [Candidatus Magnetomorum sp.]|nr:hypothetical protein [Candidatus Magnetomorum sp.]
MTPIKNLTKITYIILWLACIIILPNTLKANTRLDQNISLKPGWNAVFLKVQIEETDLNKIFENTPIKKVITYYPRHSSVQFIQDPDSIEWNKNAWLRWVASAYPDAFLNNLFRLNANRAYLVYSKDTFVWHIQGEPVFEIKKWQPESFNFTGFHTNPDMQISFADYFANSPAHADLNIYKLVNSKWQRIAHPDKAFMNTNEAYWIFCKGGSNYSGGLGIKLSEINNFLEFQIQDHKITLEITNNSSDDMNFSITPLENNAVPLSIIIKNEHLESIYKPLVNYSPKNPLQPGQTDHICLVARSKEIVDSQVSGLLNISDDLGNLFFIKVWAKGLKE